MESSGLYTLESVLNAQLVKEDKEARFYCELNYRLPSGNHMKESQEVNVQVFCESPCGPAALGWGWWQLRLRGLRATPCACADPAEKVWLEVEPSGPLKEGDRVEIRCLADGNPPPHFTISKQVRRAPRKGPVGRRRGWRRSAHPSGLSQNLSTEEMEEMTPEDNGALVFESARKEHSGLYQCQGLDLETMASLLSDPQELLVNCEGPGTGEQAGARGDGPALPGLTPLLCPQTCPTCG